MRSRVWFQRTTLLSAALLGFLAGVGLARVWLAPSLLLVLVVVPLAGVVARRKGVMGLVVLFGIGLLVGLCRGAVYMQALKPYQQLVGRGVTVYVLAETDAVYGKNGQLAFDGTSVEVSEPFQATLPGRLKVEGFGEQAINRGDKVRIVGTLYATRGSRQATLRYATLRVETRNEAWHETLRRRFAAGMQTALPEPQASFALGLLIGQRTTLPEAVTVGLSTVGLTHITAVSGYNLTIIVRAVRRLGRKRSKYQTAVFSLLLMAGFLLLTGFSASIVRATLVSTLSLWAWYYGRTFRSVLLLLLVAALTAGWNPLYLWSDIGWYLSFLAFYGVIVLVPLVVKRVHADKKPGQLRLLLYETIGAQLMTAPLIMYIFGEFSVVALVSNVLVVPFVPVAMLLALIAGVAGIVVPVVAGWIALPASWLLRYMLDIVTLLAGVPHALVGSPLSVGHMIMMYVVAVMLSLSLSSKARSKYAIVTDENSTNAEEDI